MMSGLCLMPGARVSGFCVGTAALFALSACVSSGTRPMPLAESGPVAVVHQGHGYIVDLQPTTAGAQLLVSADAGAMGNDQGLLAKRVAESFCTMRGGQVDPRALGRFQGGSWLFDGGCA